MEKTVVVLGGSGIFGSRIAGALAQTPGLRVRVAGRNAERGRETARRVGAEFVRCDLADPGSLRLGLEGADLVVHAAGPFQGQRYDVAEACLELGVHYLDIADARDFVCGITALDAQAREKGLVVGSGASSVPTITNALVQELAPEFQRIDSIQIALTPGNQNPRGVSTIAAVLSSLGRHHRVWNDGRWMERPGWGDPVGLEFPPKVGMRTVYACEVPDLELFPEAWEARSVRFHAGLELGVLNGALTVLRVLRELGLVPAPQRLAPLALRLSLRLYGRGSKNGALAVWVRGPAKCADAEPGSGHKEIEGKIALVTDDDGPATPSTPAILLARKLLVGEGLPAGAYPCMGHLRLAEILAHLEPLGIWCARGDELGRWSPPPD